MTDRQDLPGARCGAYVSAGITSYPCHLPFNHPGADEGMHVAVESPVSKTRYDQWLAMRPQDTGPVTQPATAPVVPRRTSSQPIGSPLSSLPLPPPVLNAGALVDPESREKHQIEKMAGASSLATLPSSVRDAMMASSAMTSLAILWQMSKAEYAKGEEAVLLTEDFLDRLVTPSVRAFLELFTISDQE